MLVKLMEVSNNGLRGYATGVANTWVKPRGRSDKHDARNTVWI